jgi:tetratricopeptide (TPR) repeat protein
MTGTKANAERVMADSLLKNQQYAQALPIYSRLLEQHSRDPQIQLNLGICYLYGTRRMDLAVKFLSQASTGDVSSIVYFYLAEALRQSYRFSEAIDYYRRFTISGGASDIKLEEVEQLVTLCENGSFLTRYIYNPEVYDTKAVAAGEACTFYSIAPKSGSFVNAPTNLLTPTDIKENHQPLMFYPTNPTPGTYVYYSSYGSTTTYGKDIFRIQLQDNGSWSKPENLGDVVNSNFDEGYPYIIPDGVTLYFASKGHYGMGGYDIFRTVFDPTTKRWSPPENLAFPINSPFDDFLFVADDSDSLACFATNRKVMPDTVEVILMRNEQNPIRRSPRSYSELDSIAALKVSTLALNAPTKNPTTVQAEKPIAASQNPASFNSVENDPEYSRTIAKGFAAQQRADSLKIRLEGLRGKFDFVTTAEQRIRLEKQVVQVEDDMLAAQKEADLMFVRASQIEQEYLTGKRKPKGDESLSFVSDNPDYIYQAQFAPTVFQTDELNRLAQAEQLYPQVLRNRNLALTNRDIYDQCKKNSTDSSTKVCDTKYADMLSSMQSYNEQMGKYYEKKYPIYNDCVHVALVKSGSNDQSIRKCISTAYSHFRAAGTILNNMGNDGRVESAFEANLLRELGLLQLDLAFAKI